MGGFGDAVQHMDSSDESDVVNIGIGSVPGYSIENMTQWVHMISEIYLYFQTLKDNIYSVQHVLSKWKLKL